MTTMLRLVPVLLLLGVAVSIVDGVSLRASTKKERRRLQTRRQLQQFVDDDYLGVYKKCPIRLPVLEHHDPKTYNHEVDDIHPTPQDILGADAAPSLDYVSELMVNENYQQMFSGALDFMSKMFLPSLFSRSDSQDNWDAYQKTMPTIESTSSEDPINVVIWGIPDTKVATELSVYTQKDKIVKPRDPRNGSSYIYVDPKKYRMEDRGMNPTQLTMSIDGQKQHYVLFTIMFHDAFPHFFIDYLPFISHLRDVLPSDIKILLPDIRGEAKGRLEEIDSTFSKERIQWLECTPKPGYRMCQDQLFQLSNAKVTVMLPKFHLHHYDYFLSARRWIRDQIPIDYSAPRTLVYYTRNDQQSGVARHGRAIHPDQESAMLKILEEELKAHNRPEQLIVFDGNMSVSDQIRLFQSASMIVGTHGGGLANLLHVRPSSSCEERPKVLEIVSTTNTPQLHKGGLKRTYYNLYSTIPWMEFHHLFYIPPSRDEGANAFINLADFTNAIRGMMETLPSQSQGQAQAQAQAQPPVTNTATTAAATSSSADAVVPDTEGITTQVLKQTAV